jgi:hypothetical protein
MIILNLDKTFHIVYFEKNHIMGIKKIETLPLTSGLARWRQYRRLKEITIFAASCS